MTRSIRIGLISEGEAELGVSVPFISDPKQGGRVIERSKEGALHTLIRRQLTFAGLSDCHFVHRHRTSKDNLWRYRTGHSILDPQYLKMTVAAWKPEEIDFIAVVVDEDGDANRINQLAHVVQIIGTYFSNGSDNQIGVLGVTGLAIRNFDAWLLADVRTVSGFLRISPPEGLPDNLETLPFERSSLQNAKNILEDMIDRSSYLPNNPRVSNNLLEAKWDIAKIVVLDEIKRRCAGGFGTFVSSLMSTTSAIQGKISDD